MGVPTIHLHSTRNNDRTACGMKWDYRNMDTVKSDPDRVTCPKCIKAFPKEGILDVKDLTESEG